MICTIVSSGEEIYLTELEKQILMQKITMVLLWQLKQGYTDFFINSNYGLPLWTAEILYKLRKQYPLKVHIAAPHEEQCTHWIEQHRKKYMAVHEQADTITFVSSPNDPDSYLCADEYMADHSDLLLVYDTQDIGLYIIDYAKDLGITILHI